MKNSLHNSGEIAQVSPIYDPDNLHPQDIADRELDGFIDDIDWDEIIATTQDDFLAGRFAFNSADYPTHEAAMEALKKWFEEIADEVRREERSISACNAARKG